MSLEHAAAMLDGMITMIGSLSDPNEREEAVRQHLSAATLLLEGLGDLDCEAGEMLRGKIDLARCWSETERETLQKIVKTKVSPLQSSAVRLRVQDYTSLVHYLTPSLWTSLCDYNQTFGARTEKLCGFAKILGLVCPSEPTYAHFLAIMHTCCPPQHELSQQQKFETLKSFKVTVKKCLADNDERVRVQQTAYIVKLPDVPAQFSDHPRYKCAFQNDEPQECQNKVTSVIAYARSIPLRCSNMSSFMPLQRTSVPDYGASQAMFSMFMRAMVPQTESTLRFFTSPQQFYDLQNPQLIMRPAPTMQNSFNSLHPAAVASGSSGLASPGLLALTDANNPDERQPSVLNAHQEQDVAGGSLATNVGKGKDADIVKESVPDGKADPLKLIKDLQQKRAANAAEVRKRPAAQKNKEERSTKEAKKELAAATTQTPKATTKSNQKPTRKFKAPAVGNKKKSTAAAIAGLSMQKRLLLRPNGCSKCRRKPGCTPSCLRGVINAFSVSCCCHHSEHKFNSHNRVLISLLQA
jgi:hypothetical protein